MKLCVIAITLPDFFTSEAGIIATLLDSGAVDRVHLRKPGARQADMRRLIEAVSPELRQRLSLHDCHALAPEYGCGIHINSRNSERLDGFTGTVSRSCHSPEELIRYSEDDYRFLSPVYPCISKPGYMPGFTVGSLRGKVDSRTVALGGVIPERFAELADTGFGGAAMLGCVWNAAQEGILAELIRKIKCFNT